MYKNCKNCNSEFFASRSNTSFCSPACKQKAYRLRGKEPDDFESPNSQINHSNSLSTFHSPENESSIIYDEFGTITREGRRKLGPMELRSLDKKPPMFSDKDWIEDDIYFCGLKINKQTGLPDLGKYTIGFINQAKNDFMSSPLECLMRDKQMVSWLDCEQFEGVLGEIFTFDSVGSISVAEIKSLIQQLNIFMQEKSQTPLAEKLHRLKDAKLVKTRLINMCNRSATNRNAMGEVEITSNDMDFFVGIYSKSLGKEEDRSTQFIGFY